MKLARGRILRAEEAGTSQITLRSGSDAESMPRGRLVPAAVVEAKEEASQIVADARAQAEVLLAEAARASSDARAKAIGEGRAQGAAELASAWLRLRAEEDARNDRDLEQTLALARMITERLLGEALAMDPARLLSIARQALAQARLARRVLIVCHPDDQGVLAREMPALGLESAIVELQADPSRSRGSLRFETDLGILDADLAPQLDRLLAALRDGLRAR